MGLGFNLMTSCLLHRPHSIGGVVSVGAGTKINVLTLIIHYQFNSLGWLFDQLFARAPQHWRSCECRSRWSRPARTSTLEMFFYEDDQVDHGVEGVPDDEHHLLLLGGHHVKHWSQAESYHSTKKLLEPFKNYLADFFC